MPASRRASQRGHELIEFAMVSALVIPFLFGTFVVGLNLGRSVQVSQVSRDAGHLYARNVDFSATANQDLIVRLAQGLGMTRTGGNGVVILSAVTFIDQAACSAAGYSASQCTNLNQSVITHRIVIGNSSLHQSAFGTPNSTLIDSSGRVSDYLRQTSARANGFSTVLSLSAGQFAYVSEAYVPSSDYGMPGYTSTGVYSRTIF